MNRGRQRTKALRQINIKMSFGFAPPRRFDLNAREEALLDRDLGDAELLSTGGDRAEQVRPSCRLAGTL